MLYFTVPSPFPIHSRRRSVEKINGALCDTNRFSYEHTTRQRAFRVTIPVELLTGIDDRHFMEFSDDILNAIMTAGVQE